MKMKLALVAAAMSGLLGAGTPTLRVMPLGDSITHGTPVAGGYRLPLYQLLTQAGYTVDMVGNETTNPADALQPEIQHEGHSGWVISNASSGLYERIDGWLDAIADPDVVLLHIGTNDSGASDFSNRIDKLDALVTRIVELRPYTHIVVSTLMKRNNDGNLNRYNAITQHFNPYVEPLVQRHREQGHRVHFLDMHALLDLDLETMNKTDRDFSDGLHPNAGGYAKMAAGWFGVITNLFETAGDAVNPPALARVAQLDNPQQLKVVFSKPVNAADVSRLDNWSVAGDSAPAVVSAVPSDDGHEATLTLDGTLASGKTYAVQLAEVRDLTANVHTAQNLSFSFTAFSWGYQANIDETEWKDYRLVLEANLPATGTLAAKAGVDALYTKDYTASCPAFDRVAYYLETRKDGVPSYVWVSMDAFTDDATKLGVPHGAAQILWQRNVAGLHVFSNVEGVDTGTDIATGRLEFWPFCYNDKVAYDYDDTITSGCYGSMQVHNMVTHKTIWAYNHFTAGSSAVVCLGIGQYPSTAPTSKGYDWTFVENGNDYDVRRLYVLVRPVKDVRPPAPVAAKIGIDGTQLLVTFDEKINAATLSPDCFAFSGATTVRDARVLDDGKTASLRLAGAALNPYGGDTVTVSGVRDLVANACAPTVVTTVPYGLPAEVVDRVGASELEGYQLIYATDFPATGNFNSGDYPYWYEQAKGTEAIDRVAYYFELDDYATATNYVFTAFDTPSQVRQALGVPVAANGAGFFQNVDNAFVKSNVGTYNLGSLPTGCSIEFCATDYSQTSQRKIVNASDKNYDWGDRMNSYPTTAGHGCMQVGCWSKSLMLWSITNLGKDGNSLGIGMGNSSVSGHSDSLDWTFAANGATFARRRLFVFVRPKAEVATPAKEALAEAVKTEVESYVGASTVAGYRVIAASTNIPDKCSIQDAAWAAQNFYHVDFRATVPNGAFTRVAYFVLAQGASESAPKYVWTAMDAFTDSAQALGVPTAGYCFKKNVSNLDVVSNVAGVTNGTAIETGCIEFWPSNYSQGTEKSDQGGSASLFDWDDTGYATTTGHGSMQVHNWGAKQTLWALNRFNNNSQPAFGLGNDTSDSRGCDWTHHGTGGTFKKTMLVVLVRDIKDEIAQKVGSDVLADYQMLWSMTNMPASSTANDFHTSRQSLYTVDNRFAYAKGSFDRVAYFMEVQYADASRDSAPRYALVAMDPFTDDATRLGVPYGGYMFQQKVANMDVYSNDPHITPGMNIQTGNIEFWASNYNQQNGLAGLNGSNTLYDWDDNGAGTGSGGHGSMQIHNYGAKQILICFSRFNKGNEPGVGVGANQYVTNNDPDYTFSPNVHEYKLARFYCFVRPKASTTATLAKVAPAATRTVVAASRAQVAVRFNRPLLPTALAAATFSLGEGTEVTEAARFDDNWVVLSVKGLAAGQNYTLSYDGVAGVDGTAAAGTVAVAVQPDSALALPSAMAGVAEAADYTLAYRIDLPTTRAGVWQDTPYLVDEEFFCGASFDRVAYSLELTENGVSKWVWVSMDAFTRSLRNLALPTYDRGMMYQQKVQHLNVRSSVGAGVQQTGDGIATGSIEFWPSNYGGAAIPALGLDGDGSKFDFDDSGASVATGYGSMQVNNYGARETVFAVNSFGSNSSDKLCLGIGNNTAADGNPDWTHAYNAEAFTVRRLSVYIRKLPQPTSFGEGPVIYGQPVNVFCKNHESFAFAVSAAGATRYQWFRNGKEIPGATQATYARGEAHGQDVGVYSVLVSNGTGSTLSESAQLKLTDVGTIILMR